MDINPCAGGGGEVRTWDCTNSLIPSYVVQQSSRLDLRFGVANQGGALLLSIRRDFVHHPFTVDCERALKQGHAGWQSAVWLGRDFGERMEWLGG